MKVTIRKHSQPDALILDLDGDFDLYSSNEFKKQIEELINQGNHNLLFNMEKVKYLDSTGIGVLIRIMLLLKPKEGKIRLFNVNEAPMKVLELTLLVQMLGVTDSEETALASITI
ncbi:MAG: STAS domain-containing protein [Spirochaetales bacterium]|nr:STAS domain-containing protein [Spirochaetales bacterium]